jgi:predicted nucleic acid-binding protein
MKKSMILCDTNIFIEIFRKNFLIRSELNKIGYDNIVISDVVKAELFFGARDKVDLQKIAKSIEHFPVLSIQFEISKIAVDFVEKYCLSQKLNLPDALIAATAVYYGIELFTFNEKDFRFIPELQLYRIQI